MSSHTIKFNVDTPAAKELVLLVHEKLKEIWESQLEDYAVAQYAVNLVARGHSRKSIANNLTGVLPEDAKTLLLDWLLKHIKLHKKELTNSVPEPQPKTDGAAAPAAEAAPAAAPATPQQQQPMSDVEALLQEDRQQAEDESPAPEQRQGSAAEEALDEAQQQQQQQPKLTEQQIQEIRQRKEQRLAQEAQQQQREGKASKIEWSAPRAKSAAEGGEEGGRGGGGRRRHTSSRDLDRDKDDAAEVRRARSSSNLEEPLRSSRRTSRRLRSRERSRDRSRDRSHERGDRERRERRMDLTASIREAGRERERERERIREKERERERYRADAQQQQPQPQPHERDHDGVPYDRYNEPYSVQLAAKGRLRSSAARVTPVVEGAEAEVSRPVGGARAFSRQLLATLGGVGSREGGGPRLRETTGAEAPGPRVVPSRLKGRLEQPAQPPPPPPQQQQYEEEMVTDRYGYEEDGGVFTDEEQADMEVDARGHTLADKGVGRGSVFDRLGRPTAAKAPLQVAAMGSVFARLNGGARKRGLHEGEEEQEALAGVGAQVDPHDPHDDGTTPTAARPQSKVAKRRQAVPGLAAAAIEPAGGGVIADMKGTAAKAKAGPAAAAAGAGAVAISALPTSMPGIMPSLGGAFGGHPFMVAAANLFGPTVLGMHPDQVALLFQQVNNPALAAAAAAAGAGVAPSLQQQQQMLLLQQQIAAGGGGGGRSKGVSLGAQHQGAVGAGPQSKLGLGVAPNGAATPAPAPKPLTEAEKVQRNLRRLEMEIALVKKGVGASQAPAMVEQQLAAEAAAAARQASDKCSILVQNVHFAANEQILAAHFGICGIIKRVTLLRDKFTGAHKGAAYVELSSPEQMQKALSLSKSMLLGMPIIVFPKPPSAVRPPPHHLPNSRQQQQPRPPPRLFNNTYIAPNLQQQQQQQQGGGSTGGKAGAAAEPAKKLAEMPMLPGKQVWRREFHEAIVKDQSKRGSQQQTQQQTQPKQQQPQPAR